MQFRDNLSDRTAITARTLPSSSGDDMIQPGKTIFALPAKYLVEETWSVG